MSELDRLLSSQREEILARWAAVPALAGQDGAALGERLGRLLDELGASLREGVVRAPGARLGAGGAGLEALPGLLLDRLEEAGGALSLADARVLTGFVTAALGHEREALLARAEEARREADLERQKQHHLFMQTPIAIAIVEGPEHICVLANTFYLDMARHRPVVGRSLLDAVPELREFGFDRLLDRVLTTGEVFHGKEVPIRLEHPGGEAQHFLLTFVYTPTRNAQGEISGVMMCGWDVTEQVTARRQAEALADQLRASEERYRTLFESIDDAYCLIELIVDERGATVDYRFLELNAAFEGQTGLRDPLGKTARELVPGLDESWFRFYGEVAATGVARRIEDQEPAMNRWFDVYASRVGPADRRQVAVVFKDITARRLAERARDEQLARAQASRAEAEAARRRQHDLFMQAPVAIAILDGPEHRYTFANAPYRALLSGRDVVGKTLHEALPDVRGQGFDRLLDRVMATGEPFVATEMPVRLEHHVGDERLYLNFTYTPKRDAAGVVDGVLASMVDVTEQVTDRRRVEALAAQVQLSEAQLRLAIDAIPQLISFVTADERYALVNTAYEDWFGFSQDVLVGRTIREVVGEAAYAVLGPYVKRGLAGEQLTFEQHAVPYRRGGRRDIRVTFVPRRDEAGAVQGYLAVLEDITSRRQAEQERERLFARESEARRQAEEASRLKDEFLATVSHELRTPLTSMLGWVQMLRAGTLPPDRRERALATIERNARSQAQLIDDLLDMSRILSGKLRIEVTSLDVASVVEAALETVRPAADARGVRLQAALDPCGVVMGDPTRLQQVAWNLLSNAIKFTPRGGRVQVLVQCLDSAVEVVVSDTGQGIEPAFLPHVFERFRQADGSIARSQGGLGLGLSIVQQLVEQHGGAVRAESDGAGKGATFTVRLPLAVAHRREAGAPDAPRGASAGSLAGLRLLVVDDDQDTREMLAALLEAQGARVWQAASAAEGLRLLASERPDVVLSDIGMPGTSGHAFIASVRSLPWREGGGVPAVALTAYARSEDRTRALAAGFSAHVAKPAEPRELFAVITALVRHARSQPG